MTKALLLLVLAAAWPAGGAAQDAAAAPAPSIRFHVPEAKSCKSSDPTEVLVCGRSQQRFRIDPDVLAATRAAEAPPPKAPLDATADSHCTGPDCGGGTIPLVGMALTALKAAELAAEGDDWREAFRTHADQYQLYQQSKAAKKGAISIAVSAGSK